MGILKLVSSLATTAPLTDRIALTVVLLLAAWSIVRVVHIIQSWANPAHSMGPAPHAPSAEPGATRRYFQSRRTGLWVFHRTWPATSKGAVKGHVLLLHGMGEYSGRFVHMAELLNEAGYVVHAMDHQGHGASEGDRCYFRAFSDMVEDVVQCALEVKRLDALSVPVFLLGHSMGGLIALHVAEDTRVAHLWAGVAVTGPALSFGPDVDNPLNRALAKLFSGLLPKMPVKGLEPRQLCTDPVICDSFVRDPLTYKGGIRTRVGCEMLVAVDTARAFAPRIRAPVLIQHGSDDKICSIGGSRAYMTAMTGTDDKTLVDYPDLFHELFQERSHPKVVQDLLRWLDEHRSPRGAAAAPARAGGEPKSSKRS